VQDLKQSDDTLQTHRKNKHKSISKVVEGKKFLKPWQKSMDWKHNKSVKRKLVL
jgi:hypothetical protein